MEREIAARLAEIVGEENLAADGDASSVGRWRLAAGSPSVGTPRPPGYPAGSAPRAHPQRAEAVVRPRSAEEVVQVVALARDRGIAITVRGRGTGLGGGAVPAKGGIVVSTENLVGPPEIHADDLYVVVGAGMVTRDVRQAVERAGLFYPVDPTSEASSTVGGNVGEGASGLRSLKYGSTRNYVLGLEVVTGDAKLLRLGAKTVKNVAGYDLTRLMVGSEGTLGIVTSVTLRVLPLPPDEVMLVLALPEARTAAEAAARIMGSGRSPSLLELADRESLSGIAGDPWSGTGARLVVGFDGPRSRCDSEASKVRDLMKSEFGVVPVAEARRPDSERLLEGRRAILAGLLGRPQGVAGLADLRMQPARLGAMIGRASEIGAASGARFAVWGHAGQGVLHLAVVADEAAREAVARDRAALAEAAVACGELGGVCRQWLVGEPGGAAAGSTREPAEGPARGSAGTLAGRLALGETGLDLLREIKRVIDPKGIMNPGKLDYDI